MHVHVSYKVLYTTAITVNAFALGVNLVLYVISPRTPSATVNIILPVLVAFLMAWMHRFLEGRTAEMAKRDALVEEQIAHLKMQQEITEMLRAKMREKIAQGGAIGIEMDLGGYPTEH